MKKSKTARVKVGPTIRPKPAIPTCPAMFGICWFEDRMGRWLGTVYDSEIDRDKVSSNLSKAGHIVRHHEIPKEQP